MLQNQMLSWYRQNNELLHNDNLDNFDIAFGDDQLTFVDNIDYLGVRLDKYLSWNDYVTCLCKKLNMKISSLNRLKKVLPQHTLSLI